MRARALIGVYRPDAEIDPEGVCPVIAGCMDAGTWEVMPVEESDAIFDAWKKSYDPSGADYDWREVWIELDREQLRALVVAPTLRGEASA